MCTYKEEEVEQEQEVLGGGNASFPHDCYSVNKKKSSQNSERHEEHPMLMEKSQN